MSDCDQELFEAESRKLAPARPPAELMATLADARCQPSGVPTGFGVRQSAAVFVTLILAANHEQTTPLLTKLSLPFRGMTSVSRLSF